MLDIDVLFQHFGQLAAAEPGQHQPAERGREAAAESVDGGGQIVAGVEAIGQTEHHVRQPPAAQLAGQGPQSRAQGEPGLGQLGHPGGQLGRLFNRELSRYVESRPGKRCHKIILPERATSSYRGRTTPKRTRR